MGVRISWLMLARKALLAWLASTSWAWSRLTVNWFCIRAASLGKPKSSIWESGLTELMLPT